MRNPVAFVRKELCITFTLNRFHLWKAVFRTSASEGFSSVCVACVCTTAASLPPPCIHDLKDIFVNCPGFARFQAKGWTRNKLLFDNNKMLFFSHPSNQQASYKEDIYLLFEDLAVQLCFFGVIIRSQNGTFGKPCGFNRGQSSLAAICTVNFFCNYAGQVDILYS